MAKTKEELDALKEEINKVNEKICELTPEELEQVNGGVFAHSFEYGVASGILLEEKVNGGVEISTIGCSGTTHSAAIAKE